MKILIIEDDFIFGERLKKLIDEKLAGKKNEIVIQKNITNLDLSQNYDYYFIDIMLDGENGINCGKAILDKNYFAKIIYMSSEDSLVYDTFVSNGEKEISSNTVNSYIKYIEDSFIVNKSDRYDVKGKKYIQTPQKYYFSDIGLRNARLNFRQQEENHIMENIIYNELLLRGYNVDVGVVELREGNQRKQLEVDFVCNLGNKRYYVQSALNLDTREKTIQEERPLMNINDNFKKIIVVKDTMKHWITEEGILVIGIQEFLLDKNSLDL